ncbi:MAG: hypothetical protein KDH88_04105 [Chromatiales bacterium]|nr:hypothetical protein [Chromatiales bacterium]
MGTFQNSETEKGKQALLVASSGTTRLAPIDDTLDGLLVENYRGLNPPSGMRPERFARLAAFAVGRHPKDLLAHTRRILTHIQLAERDAVIDALIDLQRVLGRQGSSLRNRLLHKARYLLSEQEIAHLASDDDHFGDSTYLRVNGRHNVLGNFAWGSARLVEAVEKAEFQPLVTSDALEESREWLDSGQIDEAREVLENAILLQPERLELHEEILEIFRHTREVDELRSTKRRLQRAGETLPDAWEHLESELEARASA